MPDLIIVPSGFCDRFRVRALTIRALVTAARGVQAALPLTQSAPQRGESKMKAKERSGGGGPR
jgi:hypothetical protein